MSFLTNLYNKTLAENERNIRFWEDYIHNLKTLDLSSYSNKLKVPVLVPIGSRILFRGDLKHTNEVTVALGADYFVKCSLKQAEEIRQHRIKSAEPKLESFRKERDYLENQISFSKGNVFGKEGQEIIEVHTEEEDKAWREKHRENVRKWKQEKRTEEVKKEEISDQELWERLEELELQEELENDYYIGKNELTENDKESFIVKDEHIFDNRTKVNDNNGDSQAEEENKHKESETKQEKKVKVIEPDTLKPAGKFELLQKVIDKQNELEERLTELRNKERSKSKTQQDLIAKLDEMEELEDLQDEMDRIEDIIETEDVESDVTEEEGSSSTSQTSDLKRRVSFADEDDSETLELTFSHSIIEPSKELYNPVKGIQKPSDIYEVFSNLFTETTSILKKTKFEDKNIDVKLPNPVIKKISHSEETVENKTIEIKDIVERADDSNNKLLDGKRPVSLFKQRRQQKKS